MPIQRVLVLKLKAVHGGNQVRDMPLPKIEKIHEFSALLLVQAQLSNHDLEKLFVQHLLNHLGHM